MPGMYPSPYNPYGQPPNPYGQFAPNMYGAPPNPYGMPYGAPSQPYNPYGAPNMYQPPYGAPLQQGYGVPQPPTEAGPLALVNSGAQGIIQQQLEQQKELQQQLKEQQHALEAAQKALLEKRNEPEEIKAEDVPVVKPKTAEDMMVSLESNRRFLREAK